MSELILPKTGLLLVSGINSDAFYEGYDQTCGIFDKSKTLMKDLINFGLSIQIIKSIKGLLIWND